MITIINKGREFPVSGAAMNDGLTLHGVVLAVFLLAGSACSTETGEGDVDGAALGLLQSFLEVGLGEPVTDGAGGDVGLVGGGGLGSLGDQGDDRALLLGLEGGFSCHGRELWKNMKENILISKYDPFTKWFDNEQ